MKNLKRIDEAVGSILERRASADRLLKDVVKGNTSEVEGIKLSKEMAQGFLDWLQYSTYGKKFGALPFYKLFTAAFNWGLDRFVKGANTELKAEFKELKAKAKEMSKAEMKGESVNEEETLIYDELGTELGSLEDKISDLAATATDPKWSRALDSIGSHLDKLIMTISKHDKKLGAIQLNEKRSSPYGEIMLDIDAAAKQVKLPMIWLKDYVKSIERMAKRNAKKFFKDYGTFSVDDWAEDMEYNFANENKVNEAKFNFSEDEVKDVAELIAKAIAKLDKAKTAVHDMEYDAGRGAGFEISMDGEKYEGGSYTVRPNGEVYNAAIGNSFPNAIYAKIGDKDINKIIKNIKKFESVEVSENYDTEQRKEMAAKGFALADGSFPIANLEDLKNAIQAYGRAKDQAKTAKFIVKRAKALGAEDLVPDTDDFQKSLDETSTYIMEGNDIGSWNQGGLKGDKNVLITTFVGPKDIEDFGLGRKCMQINVGMDYVSLNPADIAELKDILKSYKVK